MKYPSFRLRSVLLALACLCQAALCQAQATRTWVSGVGDDANPCSRTAPCKTIAAAISQTAPGGEIDALDPLESNFTVSYDSVTTVTTYTYAPLAIDRPITIDGGAGNLSVLGPLSPVYLPDPSVYVVAPTGLDAVVVNIASGAGDVILRNLTINGLNGQGGNGVSFVAGGSLRLDNVHIHHFARACVSVQSGSAVAQVVMHESSVSQCVTGVQITGAATQVQVESSRIVQNGTGISATGSHTAVWLTDSMVLDNGLGLSASSGATITTLLDNVLKGNTVDGSSTQAKYLR